MSGIAGIIHFDGKPVDSGQVEAMTAAMHYRGPDGINHWRRGNVALGQCMLRTTPESLEETQPLTNEDESLVLVMDGRVDNWEELRRELLGRGAVLRTRADAELVLRAYEVWGRDCLQHIDGDFALVIWDARKRQAFCARDRVGIKPFYYWQKGGRFAFASDFHAILALPGSPRDLNEGMVAEHLMVSVNSLTDTLITGINRLSPAHCFSAGNAAPETQKYWDVDCFARLRYRHDAEYAEHFRELFRQSIRQQTRSVTPVGVYLSGGIDSTSVACVAAELASGRDPIDSFSLVFPGQDCDETHYIDIANRNCALHGHKVAGAPAPLSHYLEQTTRFLDLCDGPNGAMLDPLRAVALQQGKRVLLTGHGGDEWFGQSGYYYAHLLKRLRFARLARQLKYEYKECHSALTVLNSLAYRGLSPLMPKTVRNSLRRLKGLVRGMRGLSDQRAFGVVSSALASRVSLAERLALPNHCLPGADPAHRCVHALLPLGWNVRGMEIENRGLALFGLEERSPFYHRKIIEYAFALPEDLRSRDSGKYVVRQAMNGILPDPIRQRHDKAEFSNVLANTLAQEDARHWLLNGRLAARGWVDTDEVTRMYNTFTYSFAHGSSAHIDHVWPLWMVLALEAWVAAMEQS